MGWASPVTLSTSVECFPILWTCKISWGPVVRAKPPKMDGPRGESNLNRLRAYDRIPRNCTHRQNGESRVSLAATGGRRSRYLKERLLREKRTLTSLVSTSAFDPGCVKTPLML